MHHTILARSTRIAAAAALLLVLRATGAIAQAAPASCSGNAKEGGSMKVHGYEVAYASTDDSAGTTLEGVVVVRAPREFRSIPAPHSHPAAWGQRSIGGGTVGPLWIGHEGSTNTVWIDSLNVPLGSDNVLLVQVDSHGALHIDGKARIAARVRLPSVCDDAGQQRYEMFSDTLWSRFQKEPRMRAFLSQVTCRVLRTSDSTYAGRCTAADDRTVALLLLRPPANRHTGRWFGTQARIFGAGGDTSDVVDWGTFAPAFVDVGRPDSTFSWCWCRVVRAQIDNVGLEFDVDPQRSIPPNRDDLLIAERTRDYFTVSTRWNRHSDRDRAVSYCPPNALSRTLFCAMYAAAVSVRGDYFLGRAGAAVRGAIQAAAPNRYRHPLDGFNNDSTVDFDTFRRTLDNAVRRLQAAISHGGGI